MRKVVLAAALALVCAAPTLAQEDRGMVEGGLAIMQAHASVSGISLTVTSEAGGYIGIIGNMTERAAGYAQAQKIPNATVMGQIGGEFRFGSRDWIVRPAARGGALLTSGGERSVHITGGWAISIGRDVGARLSNDITRSNGVWGNMTHLGAYFSF